MNSYFVSFNSFMHMGGYAWYVWPTYAFAILVLLANLFVSTKKLQRMMKKLRNKK